MRVERLAIADGAKKLCEERSEKDCSKAWMRAYFETENRQRDTFLLLKPGAIEAFVPVLVGWLIAYGIVSATRWVADGFKQGQRADADRPSRGRRDGGGGAIDQADRAGTGIVTMIRIVHNAAVAFLVASFGFMVASVVAHNTYGFGSWSDGLASTYLWNFALAVALYVLLAAVLARLSHGM